MKVIKDNIVGLFRFIVLLFSVLVLPRKTRPYEWGQSQETETETPDEYEKYKALIGSPSEPLVPTETKFCPKCHVAVAQLRRNKDGVQIIQHGKVLVTVGGNIATTTDGKEIKGFPFRCPNGHTVRIE